VLSPGAFAGRHVFLRQCVPLRAILEHVFRYVTHHACSEVRLSPLVCSLSAARQEFLGSRWTRELCKTSRPRSPPVGDYAAAVDHAERYVKDNVHTNKIENFWSLLKRGLKGTYVSVEPFHLFRYLDEQAYRFNERKATDGERFVGVASSVLGRRLTYAVLIGKATTAPEPLQA
jgi:hypothetical protein